MSELTIYLFGSVRVVQAGQELPLRPTSQMLLLYLLLHRMKYHRRELLSALFWGDSEESKARRCLNSALWRLRKEMVDALPVSSNMQGEVGIELQSHVRLDIAEFEGVALPGLKTAPESLDTATINRLDQAVTLYQGDLAENCFYDWILPERERLRVLYLDILALLMNAYSHQHIYPEAIRAGKQLLQCDPLREDVHRHLMRLYIVSDQRSRALQQYMTCWQLLHDELHLTPMPETTNLYEQIMGQDSFAEFTAVPTASPSMPLQRPPNLDHLKNLLYRLQTEIQHTLQELTGYGDG